MKILIAITFIFTLAVFGQAQTQPEAKCDHTRRRIARFRKIQTMLPARVIAYDGKTVQLRVEDDVEVLMLELTVDKQSDVPPDLKPGTDKLYWILYCSADNYLYTMWAYKPKSTK